MAIVLTYILIAIAAFVLIEGLSLTIVGQSWSKDLHRRYGAQMAAFFNRSDRIGLLGDLFRPMLSHLDFLIYTTGLPLSKFRVITTVFALGIFASVGLRILSGAPFGLVLPFGIMAAGFSVFTWLSTLQSKRKILLRQQLPNFTASLSKAISIGQPLSAALEVSARLLPAPYAQEVLDLAESHDHPSDGFAEMSRALKLHEFDLIALAVASPETQADALEVCASLLAVRNVSISKTGGKARTLHRAGMVFAMLPFLAPLGIAIVSPGYFDGMHLGTGTMIWVFLGILLATANFHILRKLTGFTG